jgi:hypothetical protein
LDFIDRVSVPELIDIEIILNFQGLRVLLSYIETGVPICPSRIREWDPEIETRCNDHISEVKKP